MWNKADFPPDSALQVCRMGDFLYRLPGYITVLEHLLIALAKLPILKRTFSIALSILRMYRAIRRNL